MRNNDDFEESQKLELLSMIKTSSESAFNLLENLLQWARTQTDTIRYNPSKIKISELIEQNIELVKASDPRTNFSVIYTAFVLTIWNLDRFTSIELSVPGEEGELDEHEVRTMATSRILPRAARRRRDIASSLQAGVTRPFALRTSEL